MLRGHFDSIKTLSPWTHRFVPFTKFLSPLFRCSTFDQFIQTDNQSMGKSNNSLDLSEIVWRRGLFILDGLWIESVCRFSLFTVYTHWRWCWAESLSEQTLYYQFDVPRMFAICLAIDTMVKSISSFHLIEEKGGWSGLGECPGVFLRDERKLLTQKQRKR